MTWTDYGRYHLEEACGRDGRLVFGTQIIGIA